MTDKTATIEAALHQVLSRHYAHGCGGTHLIGMGDCQMIAAQLAVDVLPKDSTFDVERRIEVAAQKVITDWFMRRSAETVYDLAAHIAREYTAISSPAHDWTTDEKHDYEWCQRCLYVRQANGSSDAKVCRGPARVELRESNTLADVIDDGGTR